MFNCHGEIRTRVVSLNTDSIVLQVAPGDEATVAAAVQDWEQTFGFSMERTDVLAHRGLNINSYVEVVREGDDSPTIKSKGSLAHDPGISADHDRIIVARAVGQWMLDGTDVADYIRTAAAQREILQFTEMRSAPSSGLRLDGQSIGRLVRVYRSTRSSLPRLTRDATANAGEQVLESGFACLTGVDWPSEDDVDVDWYILQARLLIAQTSTSYSPHHNALAQQLDALGLKVAGVGGAATVLVNGQIHDQALASGTEKNPRNHSGDRGLAVSLAKASGVVAVCASGVSPASLVLAYGHGDGQVVGEVHCRARLARAGLSLRKLRQHGKVVDKGHLTIFDPVADLWPLAAGAPVEPTPDPIPTPDQALALPAAVGAAVEPAALDNDTFLSAMFGHCLDQAFVCSHTVPPDTDDAALRQGMWAGGPLEFSRGLYRLPQRQNYTCISTFNVDADGVYRRQQEHFAGLHFVVLDDIGGKVKVDPRSLGLGEPTFINETSPGNQQWIYRLREPLRDFGQASYLVKEVLAMPVQGHLLTDQGARGLTRLCKLPVGMNLKLALGQPWQNRVLSWQPDLSYEPQEIAGWFGAQLTSARSLQAPVGAAADKSAEHPLIQALQAANMLKRAQAKSSGWWDILCPQVERHSHGDESGTAVKVMADGGWTFVCQHGHCANLTPRDLYRHLVQLGQTLTPPQFRLNVRRLDPHRLPFDRADEVGVAGDGSLEDEFAFMAPDDGGAGEEVDYPDPELAGGGVTPPNHGAGGGAGGSPTGPKPDIFVDPGLLPSIVRQCAAILNDQVFKRGPLVVRIGRGAELSDGMQRSSMQPVVVTVTKQWLVRELTDRATFQRWDKRMNDYKVIDCPANIASTIETGTDDATFRPLMAMASTPFLRADGEICATPGYDEHTGIYYAPSLVFPPIPDRPTWHDARAALDELLELVKEFPFANEVSKSVYLADVLTALARPTLPKCPAVLYCATMAGTGKTLMASIANLIAYGHASLNPWPHGNEEELKKVFTSILLAGDPVVVFDNVPNGAVIKSAALSQFVTSDDYADRKLGESQRLRFKNRTRVVLTGNNVTLASDNARRTLVCDLQLAVESPRDRKVDFEVPDLAGHIKAHRAALIVAGLTVLRAYAIQPLQLRLKPLESFEDWSWRVRDALIWLGQEDPVAAVQFDNDGTGEIAQAFAEIDAVVQAKRSGAAGAQFRANDLVNWAANNHVLRDALELAGCTDTSSSGKVGYWLRSLKNRLAGGRRLVSVAVNGGRQPNKWQIETLETEAQS